MASVNDYGGPPDFLASVPFGGIGGWAEAVAAALDNRDETTDQRIAALEAQVLKLSGGTLTGPLTLPDGTAASRSGADSWSPVLTQGGTSIPFNNNGSRWRKTGRIVSVDARIDITGPGAAASLALSGLPVADFGPIGGPNGTCLGIIAMAVAGQQQLAYANFNAGGSADGCWIKSTLDQGTSSGVNTPLASGDFLRLQLSFPVASP